jgi:ribonuclease VapC
MASVVLDASAVLAVLLAEPGAELVQTFLDGAIISSVNHAEVVSRLVDKGAPVDEIRAQVGSFGVPVVDFGIDLAETAGFLRAKTRSKGVSLADRACIALAEREGLPVLTADRRWAELDIGLDVRLVR